MSIESLSDKAKPFYVTQAEIDATHPMNDGMTCYAEDEAAMLLVGERHGKRDLVNLVRALIIRAQPSVKAKESVDAAIAIAVQYGGIDGAHHKDWVIDQMVRVLAGDQYDRIVAEACAGEDGPQTYTWSEGIAP